MDFTIKLGCTTTVPARRFDGPEDTKWSEAQFGSEADTKQLHAVVLRRVGKRFRVHVPYDDTFYTIEEEALTHSPVTCPQCWPRGRQQEQGSPPQVAGRDAPSSEIPGDPSGGEQLPASRDAQGNGTDDEDQPLLKLANLAHEAASGLECPPSESASSSTESELEAPSSRRNVRSRGAAVRAAQAIAEVADDSGSATESGSKTSSWADFASDSESETRQEGGEARRGRGRGAGRGRGRGGQQPGRLPCRRNRDEKHGETETHVTRHYVTWKKDEGRQIDPFNVNGYSQPPRLSLYGYLEKVEVDFFSHVFPRSLVQAMAEATSEAGKAKLKRPGWNCPLGEMYLFLGLKTYMMIYPQQGGVEQYWESEGTGTSIPNRIFVDHSLGKFGMPLSRYREIERCFTLPHRGDMTDPFDPIREFVKRWNENMSLAFKPSWVLVVDESMGKWLGKGMPALMTVPRKPTPVGREAHTTACGETGVVIYYEPYEGKERMAEAEYVSEAGKNPAKALRCTKPWHGSGRLVILDSGFASVTCAMHLADKGMYFIGNVKTAHSSFPKKWLLSKVPRRGMNATCTTTVTTRAGLQLHLLGAADMDRQPMALLGTAGTSSPGRTLHRHFTTKRADGTYNVRDATLEQMHIHELYRKYFNALDRHNSIRQGGHCFEDSWKTQSWFVRDFQMLWGISEVNAWLLYRRFKHGEEEQTFSTFRRGLCWQLLNHPTWVAEWGTRNLRRPLGTGTLVVGDPHPLVPIGKSDRGFPIQKTCVYCGRITTWNCMCKTDESTGHGVYVCYSSKRDCAGLHRAGQIPENRKAIAQKRRWNEFRKRGPRGARPRPAHPTS